MKLISPLVSIIMPVYNVEAFVGKAIESVLAQSYESFELIVVNDGTPDNSVEVIEQYCKNDSRVKLYHKENGGLSDARNFGMQYAKGDFLYFMDSDDWIEPQLLEQTTEAILKYDSNLIVFGYYKDDESSSGALVERTEISYETTVFKKQEQSKLNIDRELLGLFGYAWNKLYRRSFIQECGFEFVKGVSMVEDILFNAKVLGASSSIVVIDRPLYHYIYRERETLINTYHENCFDLILMKTNAITGFLSEWGLSENEKMPILAESLVLGIRYSINNLFTFDNQLDFQKRVTIVHTMLSNDKVQEYAPFYRASSMIDRLYKILIVKKYSRVLSLLCKLRK